MAIIWLVVELAYPVLKNDGLKVSWDDDIPNIWKNNIHVPNQQSDLLMYGICEVYSCDFWACIIYH